MLFRSPELKLDSDFIHEKQTNPNSQTRQQQLDGVGAAIKGKDGKVASDSTGTGNINDVSGNNTNGNGQNGNTGINSSEPIRIRIGNTTNFMVNVAGCCHPSYEDEIIGYVSRGRGLIIHRKDCPSFARIPNINQRTIDVVWDEKPITISRNTGTKQKKTKVKK